MRPRHSLTVLLLVLLLVGPVWAENVFRDVEARALPAEPPLLTLDNAVQALRSDGRPMLINVWASWCMPCREELPSLNGLRERIPPEQLRMVALNYGDGLQQARDFLERFPIEFEVLLDVSAQYSGQLPMQGLPTTFLVDADGRIRHRLEGIAEWDSPAMVERIRSLADRAE